ncbi:MAG: hypothetical protein K8F27_08300 [Sulfuricellaceae bacterium]|nr:hypothetical protein [Sulfuricellaceae bacterium]
MKLKRVLGCCFLFAGMLMAASVSAARFAVKDVSNTIISCSAPLLQNFPAGSCIANGPNTLLLTITTAPNEFALQCSGQYCSPGYETYIVALYQGRSYLLQGRSYRLTNGLPRWQILPADVSNVPPTIPWRLPFSSLTFSGKIEYSDTFQLILQWDDTYDYRLHAGQPFSGPEGLEIYAGVSPIGQKVFTPATFRKIWPQP